MQKFIGFYPPDPEGKIYLPWGDGACSFIDASDIGRVAAVTLLDAGHEGKAYTLTGPAAFTMGEAASVLSAVTGRAIGYVDVPEAAARSAMLGLGMPGWITDAMLELHAIDKAGYAAVVNDDVRTITGTQALSFNAFARENVAR